MTSPPGADDALGVSSSDERAALAAWADEGDVPDGFADRVVAAYLAERFGEHAEALEGDEGEDEGEANDANAAEPRAAASEDGLVRVVGLVAAFAAAAAVMLMVRVLPRASEVERVAEGPSAVLVEPSLPNEPIASPSCEGGDRIIAPPGVAPPVDEEVSDTVVDVLGFDAGLVLAEHCAPCHDSTAPDSTIEALLVFDLEHPQWWLPLSDAQLVNVRTRIQELEHTSNDQRRRVSAFVDARRRQLARSG